MVLFGIDRYHVCHVLWHTPKRPQLCLAWCAMTWQQSHTSGVPLWIRMICEFAFWLNCPLPQFGLSSGHLCRQLLASCFLVQAMRAINIWCADLSHDCKWDCVVRGADSSRQPASESGGQLWGQTLTIERKWLLRSIKVFLCWWPVKLRIHARCKIHERAMSESLEKNNLGRSPVGHGRFREETQVVAGAIGLGELKQFCKWAANLVGFAEIGEITLLNAVQCC